MKYQVTVGNVGTVVDTDDWSEAVKTFHEYVWKGPGRAAGEEVTFWRDGEPRITRKARES